jgi:hypothetical protein
MQHAGTCQQAYLRLASLFVVFTSFCVYTEGIMGSYVIQSMYDERHTAPMWYTIPVPYDCTMRTVLHATGRSCTGYMLTRYVCYHNRFNAPVPCSYPTRNLIARA